MYLYPLGCYVDNFNIAPSSHLIAITTGLCYNVVWKVKILSTHRFADAEAQSLSNYHFNNGGNHAHFDRIRHSLHYGPYLDLCPRAMYLSLRPLGEIMAYTDPNFKTKKALKEALASGKVVTVFQPGYGTVPTDGTVSLEGPHFPKPHTWYATGTMENGILVKVT